MGDIGEISPQDLARWFDANSLARGRTYARAGKVYDIDLFEDEQLIDGEVLGSGRHLYSTTVTWTESQGRGLAISSSCSCPVGVNCKHGAALILSAQQIAWQASGSTAPHRTPPVAWKRSLEALAQNTPPATDVAATPLALQFTVSPPRQAGRFSQVTAEHTITMRPMVRGAKDNWIKTRASWQDVTNEYRDDGQNPAHRRLLTEVEAASRARRGGYYPPQKSIDLTQVQPAIWRALDAAEPAGLSLVNEHGRAEAVTLEPAAAIFSLDLSAREGTADVTLQAHVMIGDERIFLTDPQVLLIGQPAHGIATWTDPPRQVRLIRLDRALHEEVHQLASVHEPLIIPAADTAEFYADFHPRIARWTTVASADGSVVPPEIVPPRVVLTVRHASGSARLDWRLDYARGDTTHRVDLAPSPDDPVLRDRATEAALFDALDLPSHLRTIGGRPLTPQTFHGYQAVVLTTQDLPRLRERDDLDVEVIGEEPVFREAQADPVVSLSVADPEAGNDWFDLAVSITIEGEKIPFADLFRALAAEETHLILASGTYLRIDRPEFVELQSLIAEARELQDTGDDESLKISRFHASLWDEFAQLGVIESQSQRWADSVQGLLDIEEIVDEPLPGGFTATLRDYQRTGYTWLSFLYDHDLGGILADDMGLGKTVQALALVSRVASAGPPWHRPGERPRFLVVAPTSVVENWAREARQFAPDLAIATIGETQRRRGTSLAEEIAGADLVVTSYALFRIEFDAYSAEPWAGLILDEAQFVKNYQGKTYQCARQLDTGFKLAITGTPLENSLMDLWALLSITAPGLYPDPRQFREIYQKPIERGEAPDLLATVRRRIRPLMRRRTKEEVLTELPPKQEQVLEVSLGPQHAKIYQTHLQRERQKILGLIDDMQKNRFEIFRSLTLLRQLSLDPALVDPAHELVGSAKIDMLVDQLGEVVAEGHRALVFSQFTGFLKRVRTRLDAEGHHYSYLDGRTRNRQRAVDEFKNGENSIFLISLKAGGFGLNLTEADYCFVLDPWWNPAVEAQAVDRTHRIGQTNTVMVYRYVSAGTIEEKVMELKARKSELFASVMDDEGSLSGAVTADDIRAMFGD